jgi:hypothetical protein
MSKHAWLKIYILKVWFTIYLLKSTFSKDLSRWNGLPLYEYLNKFEYLNNFIACYRK